MKRYLSYTLTALFAPLATLAHEGHGHTHGFTIKHYFVEPEHAALIVLAAAAAVFFARAIFKNRKANL